jgi:hypothetical protein
LMSIGDFVIARVHFGDAAEIDDRRTPLSP